jgi:hypothetical protein
MHLEFKSRRHFKPRRFRIEIIVDGVYYGKIEEGNSRVITAIV